MDPCGTYGNCKVQDPSNGSDVLAKHERPDRRNGLKLSNLLSVPHIQCENSRSSRGKLWQQTYQ